MMSFDRRMAVLALALALAAGAWLGLAGRLEAARVEPGRTGSASADAAEVRRELKSAQRALRFQTELPEPDRPRDWSRERSFSGSRRFFDPNTPLLSQGLGQAMLAVALIMAVGAILWTVRGMWGRPVLQAAPAEANDGGQAALARMDRAQLDADDLARQGDFAGAMHLLLLRSVGELRRRLNLSFAASLTSREILARTSLPDEGRRMFGDIIGRVEISWFGPHQPGAEDYQACRRSFEGLTAALKRASARPEPAEPKSAPPLKSNDDSGAH